MAAIDNFKTDDIVLSNINQDVIPRQVVMQGEKEGRSLTVQVTNGGIVEPQAGLNLNLGWRHRTAKDAEGKIIQGLDAFKPIDREKGIFRIEYTSSMAQPGTIDAEIQFVTESSVTKSQPFTISVKQSTVDESAVESESSFTVLQEALATVSNIDGKINSIDLKKADKEDLSALESTVAKIPSGTPRETFPNLAALQAKYPNGANFAVVVLEDDGKTGYVYLWNNNVWQKGTLYQAQALADESVTNPKIADSAVSTEKVSQIEYLAIKNSWADCKSASLWASGAGTAIVSYDKWSDTLHYKKLATGSRGVQIPVNLPANTKVSDFESIYIHGDFLLNNGEALTGGIDVYVINPTDNSPTVLKGISILEKNNYRTRVDVKIPNSVLVAYANLTSFYVMFALHGGTAELDISNLNVYHIENPESLNQSNKRTMETTDLVNKDFLNYQNRYKVLSPTDWFSTASYRESDGVYEIWWQSGNPGIRFKFPQSYFSFGKTTYFVGRARKLSGLNVSIQMNLFSNSADNLGPSRSKRLSTEWETFVIPILPTYSQVELSKQLFGLIQISTGDTTAKIQVDNPRIYMTDPATDNQLFNLLSEFDYKGNEVQEQRFQMIKGETPDFGNITHTKVDASNYHFVTTMKRAESDDLMLDKIEFYLESDQSNIQFAIGSIDQNNLLVESNRFQLSGTAGLNRVKVDSIPIPFGERLFMDISTQKTLYDSSVKVEETLVQDEDHTVSGDYSGMILYSSNYMIPLNYSVRGKTVIEQVNGYNQVIQDVREEMNTIKSAWNNYAKDRNGKLYSLLVNEDQSITPIPIVPKKFRIFGNSLTKGFGTFGMAASSSSNDFAAKLLSIIKKKQPVATMERSWISNWESATTSTARQAILEGLTFSGNEDLVVIQLGDNVNNDEKRATFAEDARTLVRFMQQKEPNARICWVNGWYNYNFCYPILEEIAKETDMILIDIRDLAVPAENKSKIGNKWTADDGTVTTITDSGVASHPGDLGMERIAERVALKLGIV